MSPHFAKQVYWDKHKCVSWVGFEFTDDGQFSTFLATSVADRFDDSQETAEFQEILKGLPLTELGKKNLEEVLNATYLEERAWVAGESLAEAFLESDQGVVFPWNSSRDKRNPSGSLPGADIVGFVGTGKGCRLALGEIKSSSEKKSPPQVMSGRSYSPTNKNHSGMGYQLYRLANDLGTIYQLIRWLQSRVKGTSYQTNYEQAVATFFNSGNKNVALFGVLIRDTQVNEKDLSPLGESLRGDLSNPTTCLLTALYLPWGINQLINKIKP